MPKSTKKKGGSNPRRGTPYRTAEQFREAIMNARRHYANTNPPANPQGNRSVLLQQFDNLRPQGVSENEWETLIRYIAGLEPEDIIDEWDDFLDDEDARRAMQDFGMNSGRMDDAVRRMRAIEELQSGSSSGSNSDEEMEVEGGMHRRRGDWRIDATHPRTLPPIPERPRPAPVQRLAPRPRFYTELAKGVAEKTPPVKTELDSAIKSLNNERKKVHREFWKLEDAYSTSPDKDAIKEKLDRLGRADFQLENDSKELQKIITEMGSLTASGRRKGGAKRSRTPFGWQQERQRILDRLDDLDERGDALLQENEDAVRHRTPDLPANLLQDEPHENFITKYEIFSEYIEARADNRNFNPPGFDAGELVDVFQWIHTIPHAVIRSSIARYRQRNAIREEMDELQRDLGEVVETEARENDMGEDDSGTEMEGWGRRKGGGQYSTASPEYQPRRFL